MSARSRRKGAGGERELAAFLREHGIEARRSSRMYATGAEAPDVTADLPDIHLEVKRCEALRLWEALGQAELDAGPGRVPIVAHRRNRSPWVAVLRLEHLLALLARRAGEVAGGKLEQDASRSEIVDQPVSRADGETVSGRDLLDPDGPLAA